MSEVIANQSSGFVTLDQCVRNALMDIGAGMERYETFKKWSLDTFNMFHFDMAQSVKTKRISLTPWKAIELPDDYVDWVLIGVQMSNGQIAVFTHDDRISLPTLDEDEDGEVDPIVYDSEESLPVVIDQYPSQYWFLTHNEFGEDKGGLFGLTTKDNGVGYYKFNTERREIQFSPSVRGDTTIYFEYLARGREPGEKTVVNMYAAKLIELGIHRWRIHFSKASIAEKDLHRRAFYEEYYRVQSRILKVSVEDVLECARNGYKLISSF